MQNLRFAAQVEQGSGIEGVVVGRDHLVVFRAQQPCLAVEGVVRQLGSDGVEHFVVLGSGVGKYISLLGQCTGLLLIEGYRLGGSKADSQTECGYPIAHGKIS
ncbi:hypothetical protein D3C76_1070090 [compost metagenome]